MDKQKDELEAGSSVETGHAGVNGEAAGGGIAGRNPDEAHDRRHSERSEDSGR